jgi:hypothetical protein
VFKPVTDPRARLLRAAVGFALVPADHAEVRTLHRWLDTWRGIGDIVAGMARQEYDLELRRYNRQGWRAMFFLSGFEHSRTRMPAARGHRVLGGGAARGG